MTAQSVMLEVCLLSGAYKARCLGFVYDGIRPSSKIVAMIQRFPT